LKSWVGNEASWIRNSLKQLVKRSSYLSADTAVLVIPKALECVRLLIVLFTPTTMLSMGSWGLMGAHGGSWGLMGLRSFLSYPHM